MTNARASKIVQRAYALRQQRSQTHPSSVRSSRDGRGARNENHA
jgi:hypothetical protein